MQRLRLIGLLPSLLLPLWLGGCKDFSAEIQAVQQTAMRDVAHSGEARADHVRQTLADYVEFQFSWTYPEVSWSAGEVAREGTDAPLVAVTATVRTHESDNPLAPDRIEIRFSYDPQIRKVTYLDMAFDGSPAVGDDGKPVALAAGFKAMLAYQEARAEALVQAVGRPLKPKPDLPSFNDVQNAPSK